MNNSNIFPNFGDSFGKYVFDDICYETQYSITYYGRNTQSNQEVVIKLFLNSSDFEDFTDFNYEETAANEIELLRKCQCKYVIELLDVFEYKNHKCAVFPKAETDLLNYVITLKTKEFVGEDLVLKTAYVLLKGIKDLNKREIMHRDIKPENIVLMKKNPSINDIKIIDLGFATDIKKHENDPDTCFCGTITYSAPEVMKGWNYGKECDVFSIGATLYTICAKELPFSTDSMLNAYKDKVNGCPSFNNNVKEYYSSDLLDLIHSMLDPNPKTRITAEEALGSSLFSSQMY